MKFVDKNKFSEAKIIIQQRLNELKDAPFYKRIFIYWDRYFYIYFLYRNDLIFYWAVCGGLLIYVKTFAW